VARRADELELRLAARDQSRITGRALLRGEPLRWAVAGAALAAPALRLCRSLSRRLGRRRRRLLRGECRNHERRGSYRGHHLDH
jgi:hypothetical protein